MFESTGFTRRTGMLAFLLSLSGLVIISRISALGASGLNVDEIPRSGSRYGVEPKSATAIPLTAVHRDQREVEQQISEFMSIRFAEFSPASLILAQSDARRLMICPPMFFAPVSLRIAFRATINDPIDDCGNRLLHIAARSGHVLAVWYLLESGASPTVCNSSGRSPADVADSRNPQAREAIHAALTSGAASMENVLFRRIADVLDSSAGVH